MGGMSGEIFVNAGYSVMETGGHVKAFVGTSKLNSGLVELTSAVGKESGTTEISTGQGLESGSIRIKGGTITMAPNRGSIQGGDVKIVSGKSASTTGGFVTIASGSSFVRPSGSIHVLSGNGGQSSNVQLFTAVSGNHRSGSIVLKSGAADRRSGSIVLQTGLTGAYPSSKGNIHFKTPGSKIPHSSGGQVLLSSSSGHGNRGIVLSSGKNFASG